MPHPVNLWSCAGTTNAPTYYVYRYNLELHGPDSDDEANIVRSTKKEEEPPAEEV